MSDADRTFWAVFAANLITAAGMMSFLPFFPAHLRALGVEDAGSVARWTGVLSGAAPFAAAFMSPVWGALGDRYGRRLMVVRALVAIALFVGLMSWARTPLELLALRLGQGLFSGFIAPSQTLVSLATAPDAQGRTSGGLTSALSAGSVLGPLLGAAVGGAFGVRSVYRVVSVAALSSAALVLAFAREDASLRRAATSASAWREAFRGWTDLPVLWGRARFRCALTLLFAAQFGAGAVVPLLAIFVARLEQRTPEEVTGRTGLLYSSVAGVLLVAAPLWGRVSDRIGHLRALAVGSALASLALALHAAATSYALLLVMHLAFGATLAGTGPSSFGAAAASTRADERGAAFGLVFSTRALARSVAAMGGGALAGVLGLRGLCLTAGLGIGLATAAVVASSRRLPGAGTHLSTIRSGCGGPDPRM